MIDEIKTIETNNCLECILNELEFAITPDVSNPDMNQGWSCKLSPKDARQRTSPSFSGSPSSGGHSASG
jgi:hypothetical protein